MASYFILLLILLVNQPRCSQEIHPRYINDRDDGSYSEDGSTDIDDDDDDDILVSGESGEGSAALQSKRNTYVHTPMVLDDNSNKKDAVPALANKELQGGIENPNTWYEGINSRSYDKGKRMEEGLGGMLPPDVMPNTVGPNPNLFGGFPENDIWGNFELPSPEKLEMMKLALKPKSPHRPSYDPHYQHDVGNILYHYEHNALPEYDVHETPPFTVGLLHAMNKLKLQNGPGQKPSDGKCPPGMGSCPPVKVQAGKLPPGPCKRPNPVCNAQEPALLKPDYEPPCPSKILQALGGCGLSKQAKEGPKIPAEKPENPSDIPFKNPLVGPESKPDQLEEPKPPKDAKPPGKPSPPDKEEEGKKPGADKPEPLPIPGVTDNKLSNANNADLTSALTPSIKALLRHPSKLNRDELSVLKLLETASVLKEVKGKTMNIHTRQSQRKPSLATRRHMRKITKRFFNPYQSTEDDSTFTGIEKGLTDETGPEEYPAGINDEFAYETPDEMMGLKQTKLFHEFAKLKKEQEKTKESKDLKESESVALMMKVGGELEKTMANKLTDLASKSGKDEKTEDGVKAAASDEDEKHLSSFFKQISKEPSLVTEKDKNKVHYRSMKMRMEVYVQEGSRERGSIAYNNERLFRPRNLSQTQFSDDEKTTFSAWTEWTACSVSCSAGTTTRTRVCHQDKCVGKAVDIKECIQADCPAYSAWSAWSSCSSTCGRGYMMRKRSCPASKCFGSPTQAKECFRDTCAGEKPVAVDPSAPTWSEWSPCTSTCGAGLKVRKRNCKGKLCDGYRDLVQSKTCLNKKCGKRKEVPIHIQRECVGLHNKYRTAHKSLEVGWDDSLADEAQDIAETMAISHTKPSEVKLYERSGVSAALVKSNKDIPIQGEGAVTDNSTSGLCSHVIAKWYGEKEFYDFMNPKLSNKNKHFTQLVWKSTKKIGVGEAVATPGLIYFVTMYDPPGNIDDIDSKKNNLPVGDEGKGLD